MTATRREMLTLSGLALGAGALGAGALAASAVAQSPKNSPLNAGEPHPHIHEAMHALMKAADELRGANHDFGGHRKDALQAVEAAHHQLKLCLEHAKK
jgi:hypothetical protein